MVNDRQTGNKGFSAIVVTYNRSGILSDCLSALIEYNLIKQIIIVDDSEEEHAYRNELFIKKINKGKNLPEILHIITKCKNGLPRARNIGAQYAKNELLLFIDDDMLVAGIDCFKVILQNFSNNSDVGLVGGRLIEMTATIIDKPFYLNLPISDGLSKATGFIFLDVLHGPRYTEFLSSFMAVRKELFKVASFDINYTGTFYREESDFQQSCKKLGWKLLFDPHILVYHHGQESGGCRNESVRRQLYWKGHNHTYFVIKHFFGFKRLWYFFMGIFLLVMYKPTGMANTLSGIRDGVIYSRNRLGMKTT